MLSDYCTPVTSGWTRAALISRSLRPRWWLGVLWLGGEWLAYSRLPVILWAVPSVYLTVLVLACVRRAVSSWWWNRAPRWMCGKDRHGVRRSEIVYDLLDFAGQVIYAGKTSSPKHRLSEHSKTVRKKNRRGETVILPEKIEGLGAMRRVVSCRGEKAVLRFERGRIMAARRILGGRVKNTLEVRPDSKRERRLLYAWWIPFHLMFGLIFPAVRLWGKDNEAIVQTLSAHSD